MIIVLPFSFALKLAKIFPKLLVSSYNSGLIKVSNIILKLIPFNLEYMILYVQVKIIANIVKFQVDIVLNSIKLNILDL